MLRKAFAYAVATGVAGASAAISSKLAFREFAVGYQYKVDAFWVIVFVLSNLLMWLMYTKSLSLVDSTMQCLAINTGTNYALTGVLGCAFFSESHCKLWCLGLSLVFFGVCLLAYDDKRKTD
ncbi:hypothetical protein DICVIV_00107 [Dictyocaulus viviparus]|uniref:EamA domain-containing protein n=1 Tax=Dictyocaulus viviparus TaxID=29172 RepID=A0A0D8YA47_DICVI|nr:hypothetical protein DICVIV_00107 [Dictyocaulus viviparus]